MRGYRIGNLEFGYEQDYVKNNPILKPNVLVICLTNKLKFVGLKIGDGKTNFNNVGYINIGGEGSSIVVDDHLDKTSENPVQNKVIATELEKVFQSVSNGKTLIASAVTDKGIPTSSEDKFETIADNIKSIKDCNSSVINLFKFDCLSIKKLEACNKYSNFSIPITLCQYELRSRYYVR